MPRVHLEEANYEVIDHETVTRTSTIILEKYDSVIRTAHTHRSRNLRGKIHLSTAHAIHKDPQTVS